MATAFIDLHDFIRNLVGDGGSACSMYTSDMLNSHIRLSILLLNDGDIEEGSSGEFTLVLTNTQQLKVVLQSALNIINPLPDLFQHKGPVLAVTRRRDRRFVDSLQEKLDDLLGGKFYMGTDTEFQALARSADRWLADFETAFR